MKRKDDLEELMKCNLPSASREQAESASQRVFDRLRADSSRLQNPPAIHLAPVHSSRRPKHKPFYTAE